MAKTWESKAPVIIRNLSKPQVTFTCTWCWEGVTGWEYLIGFDAFSKASVCGRCWVLPRVPPMKPVGEGVHIYG